jgi:hypothetical protein
VSKTRIDDHGLTHIARFQELEWLNLDGVSVTDSGLRETSGLKKLRFLSLAGSGVTEVGIASLRTLPNLRELHLDRTKFTRQGLVALSEFPSLRVLSLTDSGLDDTDISALKDCVNLRSLDVQNTLVTDAGIAELRRALPRCSIDVSRTESSHLHRANFYLSEQNWDGARREYRHVLNLRPTVPLVWMKLMDVSWWDHWTNGRSLDDAMAIYQEARNALGGNPFFGVEVGHASWCLLTDQQEEYERICRIVVEKHSDSGRPRAQFQVAKILALGEQSDGTWFCTFSHRARPRLSADQL